MERPRKQKGPVEDEDDAPTYVDEESHDTLTKAEYDALMNRNDEGASQVKDVKEGDVTDSANGAAISTINTEEQAINIPHQAKKEVIATIGSAGKRRIAKVVGEDPEGDQDKEDRNPATVVKKATKPRKKVKLSFDEEG